MADEPRVQILLFDCYAIHAKNSTNLTATENAV